MKSNETVFLLEHVHTIGETEDIKIIGVYSSRESAHLAVDRLKSQHGFSETPEGFAVNAYSIDSDNWSEGYITGYEFPCD